MSSGSRASREVGAGRRREAVKEPGAVAHATRVRRAWVGGDGGHVGGGLGLDAVQAVVHGHPEDVHAIGEAHFGNSAGISAWRRQRGGDGAEVDGAPFLRSRRKRPAGDGTSIGGWGGLGRFRCFLFGGNCAASWHRFLLWRERRR